MKIKNLVAAISLLLTSVFTASADNWIMEMSTPGTWTTENDVVSVSYTFDRNSTKVGGYLQPLECEPVISVKIKNNTEDFIYLDLAKTYITRNGEAELYQNVISMSNDKGVDDDNSKLSQTVMPVPPHASKTLSFPLFLKEGNCYDNKIDYDKYWKGYRYSTKNHPDMLLNDVLEFSSDNSPIQAIISFAYSTTEKGEKQARINKEFYVSKIAGVGNTRDKNFEAVGISDARDGSWFTMQAYATEGFPKAKKAKKDKKNKKDKGEKKSVGGMTRR